MPSETKSKKTGNNNSEISLEEARLIWDEYKYRHDLIWKHLIRSTIAVIALLTVAYSTALRVNEQLIQVASILAILYIIFNFFVLNKELELLKNIKILHRQRQRDLYKLHMYVDAPAKRKMDGFRLHALRNRNSKDNRNAPLQIQIP